MILAILGSLQAVTHIFCNTKASYMIQDLSEVNNRPISASLMSKFPAFHGAGNNTTKTSYVFDAKIQWFLKKELLNAFNLSLSLVCVYLFFSLCPVLSLSLLINHS